MTTPLQLPLATSSARATQADESDSSLDWDSSSCCSSSSGSSCSTGSSSPESYRTGLAQLSLSPREGEHNTDALTRTSSRRKPKEGRTSKKDKRKSRNTVATSIFPFTRSNSAANDWEGDAAEQEGAKGMEGARSRLGVSAPATPRRGLSPPRAGGEGKGGKGEGRKRSLTDVLGAGRAREVEEGLSSWINASPSPFETDQVQPSGSSSAPTSPARFPCFPLVHPSPTSSSSNTSPAASSAFQPSNLAQSLALNQLGLPLTRIASSGPGEGEGVGEVKGGKGGKRSWGFIPGPGVEVHSETERERRETSEATIRPNEGEES